MKLFINMDGFITTKNITLIGKCATYSMKLIDLCKASTSLMIVIDEFMKMSSSSKHN